MCMSSKLCVLSCFVFGVFLFGFHTVIAKEQSLKKSVNSDLSVDLIVFSYDRPLQLYACLESIKSYVTGDQNIFVLYRVSDEKFKKAYELVNKNFPNVKMYIQDSNKPREHFKPLLLDIFLKKSKSKYIAFVVDDIIVKDRIDLNACANALEKHDSYGFYLRLGKNTTENYTIPFKNPRLPNFKEYENGIIAWKFKDGTGGDWSYPNTVDMTVYRKADIAENFSQLNYYSPNRLESAWAKKVNLEWTGLCFKKSKIINIPLNSQTDYSNLHMEGFSADKMLDVFNGGYKIDIKPLYKIENKSPHMPYEPTFILR